LLFLKFQNTSSHEGQIRFLVYTLENAILHLPEAQEKMVWLIDFTGWTMAHASPIKTARETANILQNHYPERLAIGFLFNPPKVFEAFFKVWTLHIPISQIYCMYPFYSYKIKASMRVHTEFFSLFFKLKCCKLF